MPRSSVVLALSDALRVSEEYLLSDDDLVLEGVEFCKKPNTSAREEAAIEANSIHLLERYLAIEDMLQLKSVDWEKPRGAPTLFWISEMRRMLHSPFAKTGD